MLVLLDLRVQLLSAMFDERNRGIGFINTFISNVGHCCWFICLWKNIESLKKKKCCVLFSFQNNDFFSRFPLFKWGPKIISWAVDGNLNIEFEGPYHGVSVCESSMYPFFKITLDQGRQMNHSTWSGHIIILISKLQQLQRMDVMYFFQYSVNFSRRQHLGSAW